MNSAYSDIARNLSVFDCDCAVTVALKISDDSCKMDHDGRKLFMSLYHALPGYKSDLFDYSVHALISNAHYDPSETLFEMIKKERERAMAIITQDRMKAFKASVRSRLLIASLATAV